MVLTLTPELEAALTEFAKAQGTDPAELALKMLSDCFPTRKPKLSHEEFQRRIRAMGTPAKVSLSDEALSSEGIYD